MQYSSAFWSSFTKILWPILLDLIPCGFQYLPKKIWIKTFDLWQFILFWSIGAVFYSIMSSIYIIYHNSSHPTWSKLMKIPMHIEFAWNVQFLTVYAILQHLGSIWAVFHRIVKSYWKENMVCINSPSKLPTCIKFWWKKMNSQWIWLIFAILCVVLVPAVAGGTVLMAGTHMWI